MKEQTQAIQHFPPPAHQQNSVTLASIKTRFFACKTGVLAASAQHVQCHRLATDATLVWAALLMERNGMTQNTELPFSKPFGYSKSASIISIINRIRRRGRVHCVQRWFLRRTRWSDGYDDYTPCRRHLFGPILPGLPIQGEWAVWSQQHRLD